METWTTIHNFVADHPGVQMVLIYFVAEFVNRFIPGKDPKSILEIVGAIVRAEFDKTKLPNKVKTEDAEGKKVIIDANPKNADKKK